MRTPIALALVLAFVLPPKCLRKKNPDDQPLGSSEGSGFFGSDNTGASTASGDADAGAAASASAAATAAKPTTVTTPKPTATAATAGKDAGATVAVASAGDAHNANGTIGGAGQCIRALKLASFHVSSPSCSLNEEVRNRPANLTFPCAGGEALASFGSHVFKGRVAGDVATLTNVSPFQFEGCPWESTEVVTGSLNSKNLSYSYSERLKSTEARCKNASPCTAGGSVSVQ